jgi:hypothetical protein
MLLGTTGSWRLVLVAGALSLLPISTLLAGCGPLNPPQITNVSPAPSQGAVHTSDPLVITFDTPMNERSVEYRLRLRTRKGHPTPGCSVSRAAAGHPTGCHFSWETPEVMRLLHPGHPWAVITTYRVQLGGGIGAADGAVNSLSHSWEFSTEGGPQVSATTPSSGGTVGPDQAISINFSREMNPAAVKRAVTLTPAPAGGYQLLRSTTVPGRFLLEPGQPLVPGSANTLSVARSALDVDGNRLQRAAVVHFTVSGLGSTTTVVFPAGPATTDLTQVLAASAPQYPGDPPALRVLATASSGQHYLYTWPSPDGARLGIEAAGNQPIEVIDLRTGKTATVLGSTGSTAAAWSPNGQQLGFVVGGALRVYTVSDSTSVTLASALAMKGPLSWRPDGQVLAAVATPSAAPTRVALLSPALKAVTFLPTSSSTAAGETDPVWNPDGSSLAFGVGSGSALALWIYRPLDTGSPLSLVATHAGAPLAFLDPDTILVRKPSGALATVSTTTGVETVLLGPTAGQYPQAATATTTGRQVAYTLTVGGRVQVYLANDNGTGVEPLTGFSSTNALNAGPPSFTGG